MLSVCLRSACRLRAEARHRRTSAKSGIVVRITLPPRLLKLQSLNKRFWRIEVGNQCAPLAQGWPAESGSVSREELGQLVEGAAVLTFMEDCSNGTCTCQLGRLTEQLLYFGGHCVSFDQRARNRVYGAACQRLHDAQARRAGT